MTAVLIIIVAVGGFFAYKKFFAKKKEEHVPPLSKKFTPTDIKGGGAPTSTGKKSGSDYYSKPRK